METRVGHIGLRKIGSIKTMSDELVLKTLDHIEIGIDGPAWVPD